MIILSGKAYQSIWHQGIPEDRTIGLRDNGWTNDKLTSQWLQEVFEKHTVARSVIASFVKCTVGLIRKTKLGRRKLSVTALGT